MSEDEGHALRNDVNYLRHLRESGLLEDEIRQIARDYNPKLEVCFTEEEGMTAAKTLERGRYLVVIG